MVWELKPGLFDHKKQYLMVVLPERKDGRTIGDICVLDTPDQEEGCAQVYHVPTLEFVSS